MLISLYAFNSFILKKAKKHPLYPQNPYKTYVIGCIYRLYYGNRLFFEKLVKINILKYNDFYFLLKKIKRKMRQAPPKPPKPPKSLKLITIIILIAPFIITHSLLKGFKEPYALS
ncbi:hypothetical protein [Bartonella vinsonii]|uniref:hypothetical protein n=1 Tax=Bartonella vinsonii TaxID=33047 RepID=UPI000F83BA3E|nr:hypothetical protein [Bartonella vinsonii]